MADGTFDSTGSGLYTPSPPAGDAGPADAADADLTDEQLVTRYRQQFERAAADAPAGTALAALGVGIGVGAVAGFALGRLLSGRSAPAVAVKTQTELLGERLLAAVREVAPEGLTKLLD